MAAESFLLRHTMHSAVIDFPGQGICGLQEKPPTDQTPNVGSLEDFISPYFPSISLWL